MKPTYLIYIVVLLVSCKADTNSLEYADASSQASSMKSESELTKNHTALPPEAFIEYIANPENGLRKSKTISDIQYTLQYKPWEFVACIENKDKALTPSVINQSKKELEGMIYMTLDISTVSQFPGLLKYKVKDQEQYNQRVKYLSYEIQSDIQLLQGKNAIPCAMHHFERMYDTAPFSRIIFGFDASLIQNDESFTFDFNDQLFDKGLVKFTFNKTQLSNIPKLKV